LKVLVDTPIWSYAFRSNRAEFDNYVTTLATLISDQRAILLGVIRQEILSGYSDLNKFEILKNKLDCFENTLVVDEDYTQAAKFSNLCRKHGIQGSHIDLLICAVSVRLAVAILTTDKDFVSYQQYLPIRLYNVTNS